VRSVAFVLAALFACTANAAPITLKCTDSSGQPAADLFVDSAAGVMRWGVIPYRITHQNDRYISAVQSTTNNVGGEIWVLDRVTGQYTRASVAMLATRFAGATPLDPHLEASTYSGTCKVPLL
jgi:hypothetical protein